MLELLQKRLVENHRKIIDEDEIIDVSAFEFDDIETWLYVPKQYPKDSTVYDLRTWLRSEPGLNLDSSGRKCIDTRTFTRPKKRPNRTSFESTFEITPVTSNQMCKSPTEESIRQNESGAVSANESMEFFVNISHNEEVDDPLMNVSQPSIFDSSIMSLSRDDCKLEGISNVLDVTYLSETEKKNKNATLTLGVHKGKSTLNKNINSTPKLETSLASKSPFLNDQKLDSSFTFSIPLCNQSTPKTVETLNSTFKTVTTHLDQSKIYNPALCTTFKAPTTLRRELLAEIQRSEEHRMNSTYNLVVNESPICDENKKESLDTIKSNQTGPASGQKDAEDHKYYTFMQNVDSTFINPHLKMQKRKTHVPRMLSKLPQRLQKSNPNLVSNSLKTINIEENSPSIRYIKGSQPNIVQDVEKSPVNKMYVLQKMKSGSEQRLPERNTNMTNFQMSAPGGSTESIESTQSAHSAPDLDDRLSTCSDCSHNSYNTPSMNMEQLHQIMRMQQESLKEESTPKMNKRVLENTWVEMEKDLPSPITKSNTDGCGSDTFSPVSNDTMVRTNLPLLSPTGSSQSIHTDGYAGENTLKQFNDQTTSRKIEVSSKPAARLESKTRLRPPTNWNTNSRPTNVMSGIPRPPSRIPALRFARPVLRNMQADPKRG